MSNRAVNHASMAEAQARVQMRASSSHAFSCSPAHLSRRRSRRGYTLVELLITVSIIGIMASMVLFALFSAQEQAKVQKTRSLIVKLDGIVKQRYESYRTRRAPVRSSDITGTVNERAKIRLDVLRDLMRMEMPDRWSDVLDGPVTPFGPPTDIARPAVSQAYWEKYTAIAGTTWPPPTTPPVEEHQGAECLYMIVMEALAQDGDARETFKPDNIGDADGDGFPEFVDAWGQPIRFLRWAPGFISELHQLARVKVDAVTPAGMGFTITIDPTTVKQLSADSSRYLSGTMAVFDSTTGKMNTDKMARITAYQYNDAGTPNDVSDDTVTITCDPVNMVLPFNPGGQPQPGDDIVVMGKDPFDSRGVYPNNPGNPDTEPQTFALYPLIYSSGPDRCYGIQTDLGTVVRYSMRNLTPFIFNGTDLIGQTGDFTSEAFYTPSGWKDNIHNHQINLR